jgi:hypothetical protein
MHYKAGCIQMARSLQEIDEYLAKMKERSYSTMVELGSKGINYALQTAIKVSSFVSQVFNFFCGPSASKFSF